MNFHARTRGGSAGPGGGWIHSHYGSRILPRVRSPTPRLPPDLFRKSRSADVSRFFLPPGLVPAVLLGLPMRALLSEAREAVGTCRRLRAGKIRSEPGDVLGTLARAGRDKAVFLMSAALQDFGAWVERAAARLAGKDGRGILPIVRPTAASATQPTATA